MWKSIIFSCLLVLLAASIAEGLKCYECADDESLTSKELERNGFYGIRGHRSCKRASTPKKDYKGTECSVSHGGRSQPVCMQISVPNMRSMNGTGNHRLTARGCFNADPAAQNFTRRFEQYTTTVQNLSFTASGRWKGVLAAALNSGQLHFGMSADFEYCKKDNCNPAPGLMSSGGVILALLGVLVAISSAIFGRY